MRPVSSDKCPLTLVNLTRRLSRRMTKKPAIQSSTRADTNGGFRVSLPQPPTGGKGAIAFKTSLRWLSHWISDSSLHRPKNRIPPLAVPFSIMDAFIETRTAGNPLSVVLEADALRLYQVQSLVRGFGFSQTAVMLQHKTRRTMRSSGSSRRRRRCPSRGIPVSARPSSSPEPLLTGRVYAPSEVSAALHLDRAEIATGLHPPMTASVGLPFVVAEIASLAAMARARPDVTDFAMIMAGEVLDATNLFNRDRAPKKGALDWTVRMFAPFDGVAEDLAMGSATAALRALPASRDASFAGRSPWVAQNVDIGRPSQFEQEVVSGRAVRLAGRCLAVMGGANTV